MLLPKGLLISFLSCLNNLASPSRFASAGFVPSRRELVSDTRHQVNGSIRSIRTKNIHQDRRMLLNRVLIRGGGNGHQSPPLSHQPPMPAAGHGVCSIRDGPEVSASSPSGSSSWPSVLLTRFLRMLFKGMTLPFPMLRELGNSVDNSKTDGKSSSSFAVMGFPLRECIVAICSYLCLGTLSYSFLFEKWSLVDSLYYSVVVFTSVGYGDLTPTSSAGKFFTCLFGLSGLAFLGAAISTIGSTLMSKQEEFLRAAEEVGRKQVKDVFEGMPHVVKSLRRRDDGRHHNATTTATTTANDPHGELILVGWRATLQKTLLSIVPALSFLWVGGIIMMRIEGWTWIDSIYYSVITGSTIGFGDFFPKTTMGRTWGIIYIPLAVAAVGDVLGNVGSSLIERRQSKVFSNLLNREIRMDNLRAMDDDGDGKVSREEYVRFMLTEMGMVDSEEFDELYEQFERLDVDGGGYLDKKDLELMAMHRSGNAAATD